MSPRGELDDFARSVRQAVSRHRGAELDAQLSSLGWGDALEYEPRTAVSSLFAALGRANASSGALSAVLAHGLGVPIPPTGLLLLPYPGSAAPPGGVEGGRLVVRGSAIHPPPSIGRIVVVAAAGDGPGLLTATLDASSLDRRVVEGMDRAFGLVVLNGTAPVAGAEPIEDRRYERAVRLARLAVGHDMAGAARAMLELACDHARDRIQFGQPIARFQAVRHRLAETLVAIEGAEAVLAAAWEDPDPLVATMAKAVAGRAARTAGRHCQQVLAGIGFTAEHPFHRYLRRILLLDQMLGDAGGLTEDLGRHVIEAGRLPRLIPL